VAVGAQVEKEILYVTNAARRKTGISLKVRLNPSE
jgi:hypothetical protein